MISPSDLKYDFERRELLPFVPCSAHSLLDVGCGSGAFGRILRSQRPHMKLWAIESDAISAQAAEDGFDHVVIGEFPSQQLSGQSFDVILFADVLEHIAEPINMRRRAKLASLLSLRMLDDFLYPQYVVIADRR
jgi:2-polyprenyl-3-methyl-5-hydroxy-6-metoxy-1,4-benzoquinol methylase